MTRVLDDIASGRGYPKAVLLDNGPEMRSLAMLGWANDHGVRLHFVQPGKPTQNAFIESFKRAASRRMPERHDFVSLIDAQRKLSDWREPYNSHRPHGSLNWQTPEQYARQFPVTQVNENLHLSTVA